MNPVVGIPTDLIQCAWGLASLLLEFAKVYLDAPAIYLTLPLVTAHWAILYGWAEPHYLASHGLMPAGTVLLYTPRDESELEVCHFHFSRAYEYACESVEKREPTTLTSAPGIILSNHETKTER